MMKNVSVSKSASRFSLTAKCGDNQYTLDTMCAICHRVKATKARNNKCFHEFCLPCLVKWSKVTTECPLCKQQYSSIVYNQPNTNFTNDEFKVKSSQQQEIIIFTTPEASSFRRSIYFQRDLWVLPLPDATGRFLLTTPEFYKSNPVVITYRLIPWLNRELDVLFVGNNKALTLHVLELILRMLSKDHICSRGFREALQHFTGRHTEHFIHEFFEFARSPFDMCDFDANAIYKPHNNMPHDVIMSTVDVEFTSNDFDLHDADQATISHSCKSISVVPSPQPEPSDLELSVQTIIIDDGQSYNVKLMDINYSETSSADEDVTVLHMACSITPKIITLSDSDDEEEIQ